VDDLRREREREHRPRAAPGREEQVREVGGAALRRGRERGVQPPGDDVLRSHVVPARHGQARGALGEPADGGDDAVRPCARERELRLARGRSAVIGEVHDGAAGPPLDGGVRLVHEALEPSDSQW